MNRHVLIKSYGMDPDTVLAKYDRYVRQKKSTAAALERRGAAHFRDSGRKRVYRAEWFFQRVTTIKRFNSIAEAQAMADRVLASKLWEELCKSNCYQISIKPTKGRCSTARWGTIRLTSGGMEHYTLLHEMAHCAGYWHHDIGFRACLIKLVREFIGENEAFLLENIFNQRGLKTKIPKSKPLPFEVWLKKYVRVYENWIQAPQVSIL